MVEIISVHLPKTAGSTFRQILIQVYGSEQVFCDYFLDGFTEKFESRPVTHALELISPQHRVIHGHFPASKYKEYFPEAKWIIWLRNPLGRLISYYWFQKGIAPTDDSSLVRHIQETQMNIFEFAELPAIKYWSAPSIISGMKLSDFYFVGIQDFFKEDMEDLKKKLGWSQMEVPVLNENPYPKYQNHLQEMLDDSKLMNNLEHILSADMELYQEALNLREKRRGESKAASVNQHKLELSKKESSLEQIQ
ncbi:sulfotransferase family 2 domain-containing protein, partial [Microcoleus sp. B4-C5]|uniref:sulfotransferase family 2 domain-containing protein n=1 Tax=unclassified Microcoleus TaxID=2642155 RepID=UPI002FD32199